MRQFKVGDLVQATFHDTTFQKLKPGAVYRVAALLPGHVVRLEHPAGDKDPTKGPVVPENVLHPWVPPPAGKAAPMRKFKNGDIVSLLPGDLAGTDVQPGDRLEVEYYYGDGNVAKLKRLEPRDGGRLPLFVNDKHLYLWVADEPENDDQSYIKLHDTVYLKSCCHTAVDVMPKVSYLVSRAQQHVLSVIPKYGQIRALIDVPRSVMTKEVPEGVLPEDAPQEAPQNQATDIHSPGVKDDQHKPLSALVLSGFAPALEEVIKIGTFGARKYTANGWKTVPDGEKRYHDAMFRHLLRDFQEPMDEESGMAHLAHAAWNILAVLTIRLKEGHYDATDRG